MPMDECENALAAIQKEVEEFAIEHGTLQLERARFPATSGYGMPVPMRKVRWLQE